jgi:hypothetical protein
MIFCSYRSVFAPERKRVKDYVEVFTAVTMKIVRHLGYKIPVRTSQETHYVSATERSQLMLCKN